MKKPRLLINLHLLLVFGLVLYALFSYSSLPDSYAAQFNLRGEVSRWAEKGGLEYWLVPGAAVVVGIMLLVALRFPRFYNYPQKELVDRWPKEKRIPVYEKLCELMMVIAILMDIIFISVQVAIVNSASGEMNISLAGVLLPVIALPVVAIVYLIKISRLVERIERESSGFLH